MLERRRAETAGRLDKLRAELRRAEELAAGKACVYLTGSFGRGEASRHSDLDLFIAGRADGDKRLLPRLDEICIEADLIAATRRLGVPEFSGDGEYLHHYTVSKLVESLGTPQDDAANTFTARLLLLLESQPLLGPDIYSEAIDQVLEKYWLEFRRPPKRLHAGLPRERHPATLANVLRELRGSHRARTGGEKGQAEAEELQAQGFLAIFVEQATVSSRDAKEMVGLTPTQRLEWLHGQPHFAGCRGTIAELLASYERFLTNTDAPEAVLIDRFMDADASRTLLEEMGRFGEWRLLQQVGGDSRFLRMLVV